MPAMMQDDPIPLNRETLAKAIVPHVAFDGFGTASFTAACKDLALSEDQGRALAPRGAIDLAVTLHKMGDNKMVADFRDADVQELRYSQKVAHAVWLRLQAAGGRDVVRRASGLFALPQNAVEGAGLIWGTADAIWTALGDTSQDGNWYTKRATLSAVYGSVVLFWLGEDADETAVRDFIDRRIENVMSFETLKAKSRTSKTTAPIARFLDKTLASMSAPSASNRGRFPGYTKGSGS